MFRSTIEQSETAWFFYEPLTLIHSYKTLLRRIIDAYTPYRYVIERYSEKVNRTLYPVTEEYVKEKPKFAEQNVALLKNAMELWRTASQTSDAVAPMLYHYSWHCFNSFFVYTFFRWDPEHASSHGIQVPSKTLSEDIQTIEIQFRKEKDQMTRGLFQRLVDTWTLLGTSSAFSFFIPIFESNELEFTQNTHYLLTSSNSLPIGKLLAFDPTDYERNLYTDFGKKLASCPFLINPTYAPIDTLKNYLITFASSTRARYRPTLWNSVLIGETAVQSDFALHFRNALMGYTLGKGAMTGLLLQISQLLRCIIRGTFELKKMT